MPKAKGRVEEQAEQVGYKERKILGLEAGHLLLVWQKGIVSMSDYDPG